VSEADNTNLGQLCRQIVQDLRGVIATAVIDEE